MGIPLRVAASGLRVIFVPTALAFDHASTAAHSEQRRKRRPLAGNFQLLHLSPRLALPGAHPLAWHSWGHQWLRLLAPWLLLLVLWCNGALAPTDTLSAVVLLAPHIGKTTCR